MASFLEKLDWRHATRAFETQKPVQEVHLKKILEAIRLAPTSFGLQPFRVQIVSDQATKQKIFDVGWKQPQFITAPHILVFIAKTNVSKRITDLLDTLSGGDQKIKDSLKSYENAMRGALEKQTQDQLKVWASRQAYIALGFAMAACAELEVDSCPMEGFMSAEVDKILNVAQDEFSVVMLPIGYRDLSIKVRPKFRFSAKDMFGV